MPWLSYLGMRLFFPLASVGRPVSEAGASETAWSGRLGPEQQTPPAFACGVASLAEGLIPPTRLWVPQVVPTYVSPSMQRGWRWRANGSQHLSRGSTAAASCYFREGRLDPARSGDQDKAVPLCHCCVCLLFWAAPTLQGRYGYKNQRAKCFFEEKKKKKKRKEKAAPSCRTQGCPAKTEVPPLCYRTKCKGQECRPRLPSEKENYSNGFFTICTEYAVGSATDTKHTTVFQNKQEQRWALGSTRQEPRRA